MKRRDDAPLADAPQPGAIPNDQPLADPADLADGGEPVDVDTGDDEEHG
jgi:hypothetical protein